MKRYVKQKHILEYTVPITLYWEYVQESIAASSTHCNVTPESLIDGIYEDIKENVLSYGFKLITTQQPGSKRSTDARYIRFELPEMQEDDVTVIVTIVLRIATHKANKGIMKPDAKTVKYKDGQYTYTVARWFDVAGITKETALQLCAFVARMLGRLAEGDIEVIQSLPKHITKESWE